MNKIAHITTVHYRYDVRIHYKYCLTLSNDKKYKVRHVVADGKGSDEINGLVIEDLGKPSLGRFGRFVFGNFKVIRFGLRSNINLFHFHDPELLPAIILLKFTGKKIVFDMHENLPLEILTKNYIPKFLRIRLSNTVDFFQKITFRYIPVVFAEFSYLKYFKSVKEKEIILNYPIKSNLSAINAIKNKEFTIGYMGGVTTERGAVVMLNAVANLNLNLNKIKVLFIGPVEEDIKSLAVYQEAIKNGWATFTGRLKPTEGWDLMAKCHIGMAVLQDSPNFTESYPTKLFEYMLLKLPIITSNFPLYSKIINESKCGLLVDPSSEEAVSNAILKIKNNGEEGRFMGERGFQAATEKYNWESELVKLKVFYNKILE